MMKKMISILVFLLVSMGSVKADETQKFLVVLQAGMETHEGMARALHALLYSQELIESGYEVVLLFDGAGTTWVNEFNNPESENKLKLMYEKFKETGAVQIVCDHCATAFKARKYLESQKVEFTSEYKGHPSFAKWVKKGYQIIIL